MVGPEVVARLKSACDDSGVHFEFEPGGISVRPFDGYTLRAIDDGSVATIWAAGWHGHIDDVDQAVACFMWLLTPFYRVVEEWGETSLHKAWVERYDEHGWERIDFELFTAGFWLRLIKRPPKRRVYYQAAVTDPRRDIHELCPDITLDEAGLPPNSFIGVKEERLA